jgi:hypothetical protein
VSTHPTSPPPAQLPRISGIALEVWAVIALYAAAGAYLVVAALIVLPDVFDLLGSEFFGFRFGLFLLILVAIVAATGAALLAIAYLVHRKSRVGRGLAYVAAGVITWSVILEQNEGASGSSQGVATLSIVTMILALLAAGVLGLAPAA